MSDRPDDIEVVDNPSESRFEALVDGHLAVLDYRRREPGSISLTHTEVPEELAGRGVGGALARAGIAFAREHGLRVTPPFCEFVWSWLERHPDQMDVVDSPE
jgi:uncharacterized protein